MSSYLSELIDSLSKARSSNEAKASTRLTVAAGILFVTGCSCYLIGTSLNLPSQNNTVVPYAWKYNAVGAFVFTLCGLVEYSNYKGHFHIFLIFAGIFGLTAEILDGNQNPSSVHFNFLANHMYFCEAVKLYFMFAGDYYSNNKFIAIKTLRYSSILFLLGTLIDITLSWIYLFTGPPNSASSSATERGGHLNLLRTDDQKIAEVTSASLWFSCSVLMLMVYIRMAILESKENKREEMGDGNLKDPTNLSEVV